jgi:DNA uptake protein ComE-like DNA-binding protein
MVRRILRAYLSLTRGERNGFLVLTVLIMVLLAGRILIPHLIERPVHDFTEAETAFLAFRSALQEAETREGLEQLSAGRESGSIHPPSRAAIQYFNFDPNYIAYEELLKLGLSDRVARTLVKYRNSGGKFNSKQDLMKVYGLKMADFNRLEPYIDIPSVPVPAVKKQVPMAFELNGTDTLQLQGIYGIGPVFANRIIRYRDLLGGFYSREQLKEVYGLKEEQYEEIIMHVFIDTSFLRRMNLNSVERETLSMHPYLTAYQADAIIAYREYKGEWKDIHEIMWNQLLPDSVFERISPYLRIEK